ncbi:hypothetical protein K491DRAFT_680790 [Lophiostoma macrostomum CBS 122681]|uniref:Uncharacterized protein n=1 Tax=Lophiostoma macrostomum CBS 122681 TaxID=1314788 RepID=A0A6A6SZE8_9PLEO|nr:hypothetical protein K491DRAFT_680790 [Lophiostoma macrostomum CBS 122681]
MSPTLDLSSTMAVLRTKLQNPFAFGKTCAAIESSIPSLVDGHLYHSATYRHGPSKAPSFFTERLDNFLQELRKRDRITEPFPDEAAVDRKQRKPRRKWSRQYIAIVEQTFKERLLAEFTGVFRAYAVSETKEFNRGVDVALFGTQCYREYPEVTVAVGAGKDEDWMEWMKRECEQAHIRRARAQSHVQWAGY